MNVLFLSPGFPPNAYLFCTALRARGARVLAVGDEPPGSLRPELRAALDEYVFEPRMGEDDRLHDAVAGLVARHGAIDRLDSNGEHWLEAEGRLRDSFDVTGLRVADLARLRSKRAMAEVFTAAGLTAIAAVEASQPGVVRAFAQAHGFPLVIKPDQGSGAVDTFPVTSSSELDQALSRPLAGYLVQPFVTGDIVTFDGLVDRDGHVVFCTSHAYDTGIMQVRRGRLDGHYYSLRVLPPGLEAAGRRAVAAFGLRERFFHVEFFARPDGSYVALEMNVRPPGGFSTDMMSDACGVDVYDLWAAVIVGAPLAGVTYERRLHTAHAGRRDEHRYRLDHGSLVDALGPTLASSRPVPDAFAVTMGNVAYLLRHPELDALLRAIALVHDRATDG